MNSPTKPMEEHPVSNGLVVNSLPNGKVQIILRKNGQNAGKLSVDQEQCGALAMQFLMIAKIAHDRTGEPLPDRTQTDGKTFHVMPSKVGLGPHPEPDFEALNLVFGKAELGIPIEKSNLRSLGEALIALSAAVDKRGMN